MTCMVQHNDKLSLRELLNATDQTNTNYAFKISNHFYKSFFSSRMLG